MTFLGWWVETWPFKWWLETWPPKNRGSFVGSRLTTHLAVVIPNSWRKKIIHLAKWNNIHQPLRIIGGVWLSIAGFWDLQTNSFEIPWFLGTYIDFPEIRGVPLLNHHLGANRSVREVAESFDQIHGLSELDSGHFRYCLLGCPRKLVNG